MFGFSKAQCFTFCLESSIKFCEICFVYLGVRIDIKVFISHSKFQSNIQSFLQGAFYYNSARFCEIRKYMKNYDLSFKSLNYSLSSECAPSLF